MTRTSNNVLTPYGFARLLIRGIHANFAPTHQSAEIDRLAEYLYDLASSRAMDTEVPGGPPTLADRDADWLENIAFQLEAFNEIINNS